MEPLVKRPSNLVIVTLAVLLAATGVFFALSPGTTSAADPQLVHGRWVTESGNLEIDISPCGDEVCGTVSKVLANRSMSDSRKQMMPADARSPLNMKILSGFKLDGGVWKGRIYNRENGKTYDCLVTVATRDEIQVRGYKFLPVLGKTQIWTRSATSTSGSGP
jgi:uncharacterized protein (DUF2147 family)